MPRETRYRKEALITTNKIVIPRPYCHSRLFFALFCLFFTRLFYHLLSFITSEYRNTLRESLQTTSASPCRTQVLSVASFLVCSLIFIEYKKPILFLPSKQTDFSLLKPSKKSKDTSEINLLKNLSLALKFS